MEVVGWIALAFFGLIGFTIAGYAVVEFFTILFKTFAAKIESQMDVRKTHFEAAAELKKARLAKKRAAMDQIANKMLDKQIGGMQQKANDKLGYEAFEVQKVKEHYPVNEQLDGTSKVTEENLGYMNLNQHSGKKLKMTSRPEETKSDEEPSQSPRHMGIMSMDTLKEAVEKEEKTAHLEFTDIDDDENNDENK